MKKLTLLTTNDIKVLLTFLAVGALFLILYLILSHYDLDFFAGMALIIFTACFIIALILTIEFLINMFIAPSKEIVLYNIMAQRQDSLLNIIENANADKAKIYLEVLDYNSKLQVYQDVATNPLYKPMHWSLDWTALHFIKF